MGCRLSVVVPVYNVEKYLERCIKSLLSQTLHVDEIIIVDDGSPDNCGKIADDFAINNNNIIVIHQENMGLSGARNTGIERATGEYIGFVDSDDMILPEFYENLYYAITEKNADVAIIDTAGRLHNKNNLMKELEKINKILEKQLGEGVSYESLLVIDGTTGQNGLTQAKVFNEVTHLTGFVVTKLDGTAKGGIIFAISEELKKPIKFIGVGEGINDLREFDIEEYIGAIFN